MADLKETPSQTAGPYVHIGCVPQTAGLEQRGMGPQLGANPAPTQAPITLTITLLDGAGDVVKDALLEIWHPTPAADHRGIWGRQVTDFSTGLAVFETAKPIPMDGQAPHVLVWIAARGINLALTTRLYFADEDNAADPVLALAGDRANTLIAAQTETGYAHTIRLQGPQETVFFDV